MAAEESTTRSEIAERAGRTSMVYDDALRRGLDELLEHTWADALSEAERARKPKTEKDGDENNQLVFRLLSSMKRPQPISLNPKPLPKPTTREPDCEDDEAQAKVREMRASMVAVDTSSLGVAVVDVNQKVVLVAKVPCANAPVPRPLPSLLVMEEERTTMRTKPRRAHAQPEPCPHEPRPGCTILPVISVPGKSERQAKKRGKRAKERLPPAYWRPSPDQRGKCLGYALGYPSSWAPDQVYVRDAMKKGVC